MNAASNSVHSEAPGPPPLQQGFGADGLVGTGPLVRRENPSFSREIVGEMATCTVAEVDAVVRAASLAQRQWRAVPLDERIGLLRDAADNVGALAQELAPLLARELGKPLEDSAGEMGFAAAFTRHVCDRATDVLRSDQIDDGLGRVLVTREPFGVVAAIVPWNAPLILSALKVAPAVVSGNTIVVKPSPLAPFAVTAALAAMADALPPGVISVIHGDAEAGTALVGHELVAKVAFTGGDAVGRAVLRTTAERIVPTLMELGGNDPAVVLDDVEFTDTVMQRLVFGTFLTGGQVCMAAKRIYVPETRIDDFVERFCEVAKGELVIGDPLDPTTTIGPLVSASSVARVGALLDDALERGASVTPLGRTLDSFDPEIGYFMRPTLVSDVSHDAPIVSIEQFGPTVPVVGYSSVEQAVEWANDSDLGLASSVWSADEDRAFAVGQQMEAGMTFINCHNRAGMSLRVPFGGTKRSGFGREFGDAGIVEYSQTHAVHLPASVRDSSARDSSASRTKRGETPASGRAYPT